jgi:hypothetical protein
LFEVKCTYKARLLDYESFLGICVNCFRGVLILFLLLHLLDCCDGSDEYDSNVTCKNTCWEAGKAAREKLNKKVATYKSGVVIRKQEVERAKEAYAKDEAELAKLKGEEKILKGLVDKLKGAFFVTIGFLSFSCRTSRIFVLPF